MVSPSSSFWRRCGLAGVSVQPLLDDIVVELFRPQQPGEALSHYVLCVGRERTWNNRGIKFVSFLFANIEQALEAPEGRSWLMREIEIR